jgi:acetyl-CoA carboxylase biotin carboxylase subunit
MAAPVRHTVLVANRGEISVRIQRACRALGYATVAVYSDADREALHVRMADHAVRLGPAPPSKSYLDQDKVLEAARRTGATMVHPGYGFLAENAGFAARVQETGLIWVGPSPQAMEAMGDKVSARKNAEAAGVPVMRDVAHAKKEARRIGFPVLLKASAGGGGIGMRIVRSEEELPEMYESATTQAASAFGVPDVFLERYHERPRHIEVQVLGDQHGNVIHLFERECSIQRRHQKLIEEAPSPALSQAEREDIGRRAVALAKQVGYSSAGTLEFLFERDGEGVGHFYFNEMNTRLQVEHPVTEMVTGLDIVQWQLRIAAGEQLTIKQDAVRLNGHAFEARINAEDPANQFMPSPGTIAALRAPSGPEVRFDTGLVAGWSVPDMYDSLLAKLIVHGKDREEARLRMLAALSETRIDGFPTNRAFQQEVFAHREFQHARLTTKFLEEQGFLNHQDPDTLARVACVVAAFSAMPGGLAAAYGKQLVPRVVRPGLMRRAEP